MMHKCLLFSRRPYSYFKSLKTKLQELLKERPPINCPRKNKQEFYEFIPNYLQKEKSTKQFN